MNHATYNAIVKSTLRDLVKYCLPDNITDDINYDSHIGALRIYIDSILTRYPAEIPYYINNKIDSILQHEKSVKKLIGAHMLIGIQANPSICLYTGDITQIHVDCIVNAGNPTGHGCLIPGHKCVDNIIHLKAGPKLRAECKKNLKGGPIAFGELIVTLGYNLPARYVYHTVGPVYNVENRHAHQQTLSNCYVNCLDRARQMNLGSIIFPCISTGEYKYPKAEACVVALKSTNKWLEQNPDYAIKIIFCVFDPEDKRIYDQVINSCLWRDQI